MKPYRAGKPKDHVSGRFVNHGTRQPRPANVPPGPPDFGMPDQRPKKDKPPR